MIMGSEVSQAQKDKSTRCAHTRNLKMVGFTEAGRIVVSGDKGVGRQDGSRLDDGYHRTVLQEGQVWPVGWLVVLHSNLLCFVKRKRGVWKFPSQMTDKCLRSWSYIVVPASRYTTPIDMHNGCIWIKATKKIQFTVVFPKLNSAIIVFKVCDMLNPMLITFWHVDWT